MILYKILEMLESKLLLFCCSYNFKRRRKVPTVNCGCLKLMEHEKGLH